jgi:hypothetical protein
VLFAYDHSHHQCGQLAVDFSLESAARQGDISGILERQRYLCEASRMAYRSTATGRSRCAFTARVRNP